ncbi:hypothetical protein SAMN06265368_1487 [Cohaesibacter gelatinilyticus]|uniref:Uncharacterized protein n=1 Tax=Cohaesibacter gelatinilyticus TaxID=372072 RepID=A0A285NGQ9_9HYPH|nr:hypothetical protein SAMN06265368_1487 [Cohaesibacter gelatinilyticus]
MFRIVSVFLSCSRPCLRSLGRERIFKAIPEDRLPLGRDHSMLVDPGFISQSKILLVTDARPHPSDICSYLSDDDGGKCMERFV